jgi:2-dehydropantoate 2-reductase
MRFCIVGAGAIGGVLGARLAEAGHEVSLIARGAHLDAIRAQGLAIKDADGVRARRIPAAEDPAAFGPQDAIVVALKAYAIGPMLPRLAPLLAPETAVVAAINGIPWWYFHREGGRFDGRAIESVDPGGAMLRALDPGRIIGCVVHGSAEVVAPGVVHHTSGGAFILGEPDGRTTARVAAIAAAIESAGIRAPVSARIRDDLWTKLIGNASYNPVAALTGALMSDINANAGLLALIRRIMIEAIQVADALGARMTVTLDERFALARKLGDAKVSMLQDLEKGRPLEIDAIVTAVGELGARVGVPTPTLDAVDALIRERVRHRWMPPA